MNDEHHTPGIATVEIVRVLRVLQDDGLSLAQVEELTDVTAGLLGYLERVQPHGRSSAAVYDKLAAAASARFRNRPGHPWAEADDLAGRIHDALRMLLRGATMSQIEQETDLGNKQQQRIRDGLDLAYTSDGDAPRLIEEQPGALDHVADLVRQLDAAFDKEDDLVLLCLRLGLLDIRSVGFQRAGIPRIPISHPAAVAWRREQETPAKIPVAA